MYIIYTTDYKLNFPESLLNSIVELETLGIENITMLKHEIN